MSGIQCDECKKVMSGNFVSIEAKLMTSHFNTYKAQTTILLCLHCAKAAIPIPEDWLETFKVGDQVAYIPDHAHGIISHPDVQYGFVAEIREDYARCRYWSKTSPELRTQANSENTYYRHLVHYRYVNQDRVDLLLVELGYVDPFKEVDING